MFVFSSAISMYFFSMEERYKVNVEESYKSSLVIGGQYWGYSGLVQTYQWLPYQTLQYWGYSAYSGYSGLHKIIIRWIAM